MAIWKCAVCGSEVEARCKPGKCKVCGAAKENLVKQDAQKKADKED
ncbi:MAG: RCKP-type rubredoxin-like domain-containing protein [Desulfotomaculales bacterium]